MTAPDPIDALVSEQLTHPQDDYSKPYAARCPLDAKHLWHGLPIHGCVGPYGGERPEWMNEPVDSGATAFPPEPRDPLLVVWEFAGRVFNTGWTVVDSLRALWRQR